MNSTKMIVNYYNKKCLGCGQYFSKDVNNSAYVIKPNEKTKFCKRCFQLKHYKKIDNSNVSNEMIINQLKEIDFKDNKIIMVIDLFDVINSIVESLKNCDDLIIVVNKLSCLPRQFNSFVTLNKLKEIFIENKVKFKNIILYDSVEKKNIKKIMDEIKVATFNRKKVYIVGKTNSGKSSLINALLKFNKLDQNLSVSPFPNTTISLSKVKIDRHIIIDTPGFINETSILSNINNKDIDKINNSNKFISKTFLLKDINQAFLIEKLFYIKPNKINDNSSITFYNLDTIKVHRTKQENILSILKNEKLNMISYKDNEKFIEHEYKLDNDKKYNIFVNGISLISIKNINNIIIGVNKKIKIYITENALI